MVVARSAGHRPQGQCCGWFQRRRPQGEAAGILFDDGHDAAPIMQPADGASGIRIVRRFVVRDIDGREWARAAVSSNRQDAGHYRCRDVAQSASGVIVPKEAYTGQTSRR